MTNIVRNLSQMPRPEYLYIVQTPEFIKTNEKVYKFGKTKQALHKRMEGYPINTMLYMSIIMDNVDYHETEMLRLFRSKYIQRKDAGDEYFECDVTDMMCDLYTYWLEHFNNIWKPSLTNNSEQLPTLTPEQWFKNNYKLITKQLTISGKEKIIIQQDKITLPEHEELIRDIGFEFYTTRKAFVCSKSLFNEYISKLEDHENNSSEDDDIDYSTLIDSYAVYDDKLKTNVINSCDLKELDEYTKDLFISYLNNNSEWSSLNTSRIKGWLLNVKTSNSTETNEEYLERIKQPLSVTQYEWRLYNTIVEKNLIPKQTSLNIHIEYTGNFVVDVVSIDGVSSGKQLIIDTNNIKLLNNNESQHKLTITGSTREKFKLILRKGSLKENIANGWNKYIIHVSSLEPKSMRRSKNKYFTTTVEPEL